MTNSPRMESNVRLSSKQATLPWDNAGLRIRMSCLRPIAGWYSLCLLPKARCTAAKGGKGVRNDDGTRPSIGLPGLSILGRELQYGASNPALLLTSDFLFTLSKKLPTTQQS